MNNFITLPLLKFGNLQWLLFFLLFSNTCFSQAPVLSPTASISLITCGVGDQLFEAFGHSAVRVTDPENQLDIVYNYGTFDFNQPNFYLNFAKGYLRYFLSRTYFDNFKNTYIYYNRSISEQILNLNQQEKQALFDFLENNYLPENRYYFYDYYYDNCSTRIRDALQQVLGDSLAFSSDYVKAKHSFRSLTDLYIIQTQPWGDFGIDLGLGSPIDKIVTPYDYMFLPDYLAEGFAHATITTAGHTKPLVAADRTLFVADHSADTIPWFTPARLFWIIWLIIAALTIAEYRKKVILPLLDFMVFFVYGFLGTILFLIWTATDHHAAANNFNVLWAFPLHLPFAFLFIRNFAPKFFRYYLIFTCLLSIFLLARWNLVPQDLHIAIIPLILIIFTRSFFRLLLAFQKK